MKRFRFNSPVEVLSEAAIMGLIALLVYISQVHFTQLAESSGDSFVRWYEVKRLFYGFDFSRLDHHTMRWAVNLPVLACQKLFGTSPSTYYIPSSAFTTLSALFCYKIGRLSNSRLTGLIAAVLFVLHPSIVGASSQLFPGIFTITYILGAIYFILLYVTHGNKEQMLVAGALCLFCAYGCKVTAIYFIPAFVIFLFLYDKNMMAIFKLLGILFIGFIVESLWINIFILEEPFALGRLTMLGGHSNLAQTFFAAEKTWLGVFLRWEMLIKYLYMHTLVGFFVAVYYISRVKENAVGALLSLCFLSFAFFITFAVLNFDPVTFVSPLRPRYLNVTIPLTLMIALIAVAQLGKKRLLIAFCIIYTSIYPNTFYRFYQNSSYNIQKSIDDEQRRFLTYFNTNRSFFFASYKYARLYRALFVNDMQSIGLQAGEPIKIYLIPPGNHPVEHTRNLYAFSKDNQFGGHAFVMPQKDYTLKVTKTNHPIKSKADWLELW